MKPTKMEEDKKLQPNYLAGAPTRTSLSLGRVVKQVKELVQTLRAQELMMERQGEDLRRMRAEKQELEDLLRKNREELAYWASLGPVSGSGQG